MLPKLAVLQLTVFVLLALWLASWSRPGRRPWRRTPLDAPLAIFVGSALLSTAFAVNHGVALFGTYYRYEGLLTIAGYGALYWLAARVLRLQEAWRVVRLLVLVGYAVALLAIVQSVVLSVLIGGGASESGRQFAGVLRAASTFGNPYPLSAFLALVLPLAAHEVVRARSPADCLLAAGIVLTLALTLLLTFSRSAWLGALLGLGIVVARPLGSSLRSGRTRPLAVGVLAVCALGLAAGGVTRAAGPPRALAAVVERAVTLADPAQGSGATRLHVWRDTVELIAARPLVGWGPDTFALVYPNFQTGDWTPGFEIDRAHAELLQVAANQGLVGLAAYLWLLGAVAVAFWRGRAQPGASALFGAWIAYQLSQQAEFSWLPSAAPAWLLTAAAVTVWAGAAPAAAQQARRPGLAATAGPLLAAAVAGLGLALAAVLLAADAEFLRGLGAAAGGDRAAAQAAVAEARRLAPWQAVYATEAGDLALEEGPDSDPAAAREAYLDAISRGDTRPVVFRRLADACRQLGRMEEAAGAERMALRRFERERG